MWTRSLSVRAALIAAGSSALALLVAGGVLIVQFSNAEKRNFDLRLETLFLALVRETDINGEVNKVAAESEGTFERPLSGWYWQTRDPSGKLIDWSPSLNYDILPVPDLPASSSPRILTIRASAGRELRALEQLVTFAPGHTYALLVAGDTAPMRESIAGFRGSVVSWLGGLAVLLAVGMALLLRWGFRPLRQVREDLRKVRDGDIKHLGGRYPSEIEPLVSDLNALIESNREIVERARTHVGNLAHALKTPLAVLQNETHRSSDPLAQKVVEQTAIMRGQVEHHLNRARIAGQANVLGAVTPLEPVLSGLARVMAKVHQDRHLTIEIDVAPGLRFRGERQDFEEMAGNLLDNACKWATTRVRVSARREGSPDDPGRRLVSLSIDDDGPGLAPDDRAAALLRGGRLDESKPGSGLGLSIVSDLASVYGGRLGLEESPLGGLSARLILPAAGE